MTREVSKDIQCPTASSLGDCWADINYCMGLGLERNEIIRLAAWRIKGSKKRWCNKLLEILPLFENDDMVQIVESEATVPGLGWRCGHIYPPSSTKIKWSPNSSKKICYQFDARSKVPARFPSKEIEDEVLNHVIKLGYEVIKLSAEKTLKECVTEVANCEIFLGVDSGMATLTASVGTPIFFCKNNRPIEVWETMNHSKKHYIIANDYIELMYNISEYTANGISHYVKNAKNISFFSNRE